MAAAVSAFGLTLVTAKGSPCTLSDYFRKRVTALERSRPRSEKSSIDARLRLESMLRFVLDLGICAPHYIKNIVDSVSDANMLCA